MGVTDTDHWVALTEIECTQWLAFQEFVIPGRAEREPGIHNHDNEYGFRACAKRRIPE